MIFIVIFSFFTVKKHLAFADSKIKTLKVIKYNFMLIKFAIWKMKYGFLYNHLETHMRHYLLFSYIYENL